MAKKPPAEGVFGWLGRQVGHVKKAVKTKPGPAPQRPPARSPEPPPAPAGAGAGPTPPSVIYREGRVEEADHPTQPGVKLRRTIIDEIVVKPPAPPATSPTDRD